VVPGGGLLGDILSLMLQEAGWLGRLSTRLRALFWLRLRGIGLANGLLYLAIMDILGSPSGPNSRSRFLLATLFSKDLKSAQAGCSLSEFLGRAHPIEQGSRTGT
jgi:hypothetical protein